jgi:hypothetical protein
VNGEACTIVTPTCTPCTVLDKEGAVLGSNTNLSSSLHPQSRPTLRTAGTLQGVPPSCCGRRVALWSGVSPSRHQGFGSGTTRKQPANLAVEGAEEFLSILPDYKPTVRPRPSAVDHLDRDMLQRLTCSRTATVVFGVRYALAYR